MKLYKYIYGALFAAMALTSCQDHFDQEVIEAPKADKTPNMTIFELKQMYWNDAVNYVDTIGIENGVDDGRDYVIAGRVVSSDEAGNVFKSLVIQDETAAIALSINSYNLYLKYRRGQEVVIDLKGMYIGKYNGLVQLGMPEWYANGNAWEVTFMAPEFFEMHAQRNGFPEASKIDTLQINSFDQLPTNPDGLCRYQSRIVKFNNVYFQNAGEQQFSEYHSSGVNQNIVDVNGSTLPVRTSGYSNFWNQYLPEGNGDVVCILSYYGTTGWQLVLNDYEGCMNFGNPTVAPGAKDKPYTVAEAIATIAEGHPSSGWVSGYIVGAVAPEVTQVSSNADIEWGSDVVLKNTLVIGATPDTKDINQAMVIALPAGSALREYGNLPDHPDNYKKKIDVKGTFGMYMNTYGILDNTGKADVFEIEGVTVSDGSAAAGNGTEASPYNVAQVIAKNPQGNADNPDEKDVWVTGYIVGWADMSSTYYINAETARFTVPATMATNILVAATPDVTNYAECIGIQLPSGAVRSALNLMDNPGNLGREVVLKGNIAKYSGVPGIRSVSEYKWLGDAPDVPVTPPDNPNPGTGVGSENDPYSVAQVIAKHPSGNADNPDEKDVWVDGYIVGWADMSSVYYINAETARFSAPATMATNILLADEPSVKDYAKCIGIQLPSGNVRSSLNLMDNPGNLGRKVKIKGNIAKYSGVPGLRSASAFVWEGDAPNTPDNPDNPDTPDNPVVTGNSADFNTFNDGKPNTMSYGTFSTASGWTATWSQILAGGTDATNFASTDGKFLFPCLDGSLERKGTLTSPTLADGLGTLKFDYGFPFNEKKVQFTINIKQGGKVVASDTVLADPATKATVYNYSHAFNVKGAFVIEIVNDCVTNTASGNKDRVAIWNLTWTN